MSKKYFPSDVRDQAKSVLDAWRNIDPSLNLGEVTQAAVDADLAQALNLETQLNQAEDKVTELRNQRDDLYAAIWDKVKRVRRGIQSIYGDDSSQYERVGGTRISERARPQHAATEEKAPVATP